MNLTTNENTYTTYKLTLQQIDFIDSLLGCLCQDQNWDRCSIVTKSNQTRWVVCSNVIGFKRGCDQIDIEIISKLTENSHLQYCSKDGELSVELPLDLLNEIHKHSLGLVW